PAEADPQLGCTPGDGEADPGTIDSEGPLPKAHRDQCPLATGEAGTDTGLLPPRSLEEGDRIVLQDRLGAVPGQLPEAHARELPAQSREVGHPGPLLLGEPAVPVDHPGPRVPGAAQQTVAAPPL